MKELTFQDAEKIACRRLDRRRKYATTENGQPEEDTGAVLFEICNFTTSCSGCTETVDGHNSFGYPIDPRHGCLVGGGCPECGYTGKVRQSHWVPTIFA